MKSAAETEKEFDTFMERLAFTRVSADVGESPNFKNADYVNKYKNIVIELKVLEKEFFPSGGVIDAINSMIVQPVNIDNEGIGQYEWTLPKENREGKHDNFEEPLRRVIKKANTQIKETRKYYFGDTPSLGFVIIAQTGLQSLSADVTAQVVRKILNQEFNSIDGAIVCTPHHRTRNPITQRINSECVSVTNENSPIRKSICMRIADEWIEFLKSNGHGVIK